MDGKTHPCTSIVIPIWNKFEITNRFLTELFPLLKDGRDEVIVVDNGSTDLTPKILKWWKAKMGNQLKVIRNTTNLGFGPAVNIGAAQATGAKLIIMNNDVGIFGNFIIRTLEHLDNDGLSIVVGRKVDWDGGWNRFGDQLIEYGEGWYLGMVRNVWEDLEGFDEQFVPCDYEDVDFSYRATRAGFELVDLSLPIRHLGGTSGNQIGSRETITRQNREKFAVKWGLVNTPC